MSRHIYHNGSGFRDPTAAKAILKTDRRNKYGNRKTERDGIVFDSKKEADRYTELLLLQRAGHITGLQRQVRYELIPAFGDERAVFYFADFVYIDSESGKTIVEDVKSVATKKDKAYILKRKYFKWKYRDVEFMEV